MPCADNVPGVGRDYLSIPHTRSDSFYKKGEVVEELVLPGPASYVRTCDEVYIVRGVALQQRPQFHVIQYEPKNLASTPQGTQHIRAPQVFDGKGKSLRS